MRKIALVAVVGIVGSLVACAASPDEGSASATGADTTNTSAPRTGRATGRTTTPPVRTTNADAGTTTNAGDASAPAASCYAGNGDCDPTNATACDPGATCDIDGKSGQFTCFPPPNDAKLGEACDNGQGPFCGAGMACNAGVCATYCCDDSQCATGTTCQGTGSVGSIIVSVCQ